LDGGSWPLGFDSMNMLTAPGDFSTLHVVVSPVASSLSVYAYELLSLGSAPQVTETAATGRLSIEG